MTKVKIEKVQNSGGVTLIALVVTIIVLMILAGISIATLTGDNGIITKAQEAKEKAEKAQIEEQLNLAILSATTKKLGGAITAKDIQEELKSQGIDFDYDEEEGTLIIEGQYIFEQETKEDGSIGFGYQGTTEKPIPKIVSIETSYEGNTIVVRIETKRNEGGNVEVTLIEEDGNELETKTITNTTESNVYECTFEGIDTTKNYIVKVIAISANGEKAEKQVETVTVPGLTSTTVTLSYSVNGSKISETEWTKGPVVVTVDTKNIDMKKYRIETSQDNTTWKEAKTQTYAKSGTLYVRLKDMTTGQKGKAYEKRIQYIDTIKPIVTGAVATTNSIEITATDEASGIVGYAVTENTTEPTSFINCENTATLNVTVTEKIQSKTYYVWVKDKVGNISEYKETTTETVEDLTQANTTFVYQKEDGTVLKTGDWTNRPITVTATSTVATEGFWLQYKTELYDENKGDEVAVWTEYPTDGVTVTRNQKIYFRLWDGTNAGNYATANVEQIDIDKPEEFTPTAIYSDYSGELKDAGDEIKQKYKFKGSYTKSEGYGNSVLNIGGNQADIGKIVYILNDEGYNPASVGYHKIIGISSPIGNNSYLLRSEYLGTSYWIDKGIIISGETTDATSEISYYQYSKDDGATWEPSIGQSGNSYAFAGLTPGQMYTFRMKAVDKAGNDRISEPVTGHIHKYSEGVCEVCGDDVSYQSVSSELSDWEFSAINSNETRPYKLDLGFRINISYAGNMGMLMKKEPIDITNVSKIVMNCGLTSNSSAGINTTTIGISKSNAPLTADNRDDLFEKSASVQYTPETANTWKDYQVELDVSEYTGTYYLKIATQHQMANGTPNNSSFSNLYKIFPVFPTN